MDCYWELIHTDDEGKSVLRKTGWIKERNRKTKDIKFSLDVRFQKKKDVELK